MQAITTKYVSATNTRGSRIKASCQAGSISIPYPSELTGQACHRAAAEVLAQKMGWTGPDYGPLLGGGIKDGYVFVFDNSWARD